MPHQPFVYETTLDMCSVDFTGSWQPGAVFRTMQEASDGHCHLLHVTFEEVRSLGLAWVATRGHLQMDRYPTFGQKVTVNTWPGKTRHMFFPRYYTFAVDGEVIGRAAMVYVLIDLETRKIALPARLGSALPEYDIPAPLPFPGNLRAIDAPARTTAYSPLYTDLDMNGHVNNTRYVDWFMNQFPADWHQKNRLTDLLVHYNFEVLPGETLTLSVAESEGASVMQGLNGDTVCFGVEGRWQLRA